MQQSYPATRAYSSVAADSHNQLDSHQAPHYIRSMPTKHPPPPITTARTILCVVAGELKITAIKTGVSVTVPLSRLDRWAMAIVRQEAFS